MVGEMVLAKWIRTGWLRSLPMCFFLLPVTQIGKRGWLRWQVCALNVTRGTRVHKQQLLVLAQGRVAGSTEIVADPKVQGP